MVCVGKLGVKRAPNVGSPFMLFDRTMLGKIASEEIGEGEPRAKPVVVHGASPLFPQPERINEFNHKPVLLEILKPLLR